MKNLIFFLIISVTVAACGDNRSKVNDIVFDKIESINEEQETWNNLTQQLLEDEYVNSHLGLYINPKNLPSQLYDELKEKGVIRLSATKNKECQDVEYSLDWMKKNHTSFYLTWSTCDAVQTKKGYYKDNYESNSIEVWGVGNNWLIWIDSDPL